MRREEAHAFVLEFTRAWPGSHPDDYDPTDDQLIDLVLAARNLALEEAAECAERGDPELVQGSYRRTYADAAARIRALKDRP